MTPIPEKDEAAVPFLPSPRSRDDEFVTDIVSDQSPHTRRTWRKIIASFSFGAILSSLLWLIVWSLHPKVNTESIPAAPTATTSCGSNYTSAIANNCTFQLWSYSWVPPECFDKELHDEFIDLREEEDWHYYSSLSPLIQVPLDSVLAGNRNDLHSTWGQHFWHCAFYQRKFFRIVEENDGERTPTLKMTNRDLDAGHAMHCQKWLANPQLYPWDEVRINLTVGYHSCS